MQIKRVPIDYVKLDAENSRKHPDKNMDAIIGSIKTFGQVEPLVVQASTKIIIGGNGRVEAMRKLGFKEIDIVEVDVNDVQAKAMALALNRSGELAEWNMEQLQTTLDMLKLEDFDLDAIGFDDSFFKNKENGTDGLTDPDEVPENVETRCKPGDLWQLGNHRLLCGDSTKIDDVERLMGGEKADMVFTDPPYGVSYTKKTKEVFKTKNYTEIENDDKSGNELLEFFRDVFSALRMFMTDSCSYYVCSPQGGDSEMMMMMMMRESDMKCRHQIIWLKDSPVFSMGRLDYDYKHEPILYGWTKRHDFKRKGSQDKSVWEFKRTENKLHPTMKPVELIENAILNSSDNGNLVTDIFLGSGSTLIACEKTGRKCYGMEIDPHYCDVIIKRWEQFTGKEATLCP